MNRQSKARSPQAVAQTAASGDLVDAEPAVERLVTAPAEDQTSALIFLRAIIDNLGEGTYALDRHGRVTFMNPAAERMLGWTEAELRGREMHSVIHFQHADGTPFPRGECPLVQVLRSGIAEQVEDDTFTRKDGSMFSVAYVSSPIIANGEITGAVLAFRDTSVHKALDEALRRSERDAASRASQLVAIFESMADAVLVYDRDGRILQTNGADAAMFDVPLPLDALSDSFGARDRLLTYLDESGQPMPDEQRPSRRVLRGEVLRGESAIDLFVRPHGGREVILNISGAPIRDSDGNIVGGVLIGRDVTQRRRQERQAREALAALMAMAEALVSSTPDDADLSPSPWGSLNVVANQLAVLTRAVIGCERVSIVATDPDTDEMHVAAIASVSAEQERVWRANWPRASRLSDFLPDALIARLKAGKAIFIDRTLPPFNSWPNPFGSRALLVIPLRVGERHLGEMTLDYGATTHQSTEQELAMTGAIAKLAAQIIERERLARDREIARANALALAETARRMDEFLSIAAHELKTPVTNSRLTVTLAIDTLKRFIAEVEALETMPDGDLTVVQKLLERTGDHMDRLSRLVVDLLDVSRIRAGKLQLRLAPCNLAQVVRDVVEEQRQMAPGRVIRLQLPRATRLAPVVLADEDRIRQVVANFLTNALKYSEEYQRVSVCLRTNDGWARLSVRDEGPGIPSAEQRRVWERFYRVPGTQVVSGAGIGLGLGLHISRTIIEQHQGRVGLRSARGSGSIFWFALQLAPEAD
jgi:PAS domain S-box-containing protein